MDTDDPGGRDDWDLAELARAGDEAAYAELIARHQSSIHRFIFRYVADEETARDLTQEVFVKAWFALARLERRARLTTWLFQIAVNLCRDHARSRAARQARRTSSLVRESPGEGDAERDLPDPGASPDRQAQNSELMALLDAEIQKLPPDLREALILGAVEGRPHKEIAAILGLTPKAVEVRIYRARRILAGRLGRRGIGITAA